MTTSTDLTAALRLQAWLSPAFPTGAFSYSHGLEAAYADGRLGDDGALQAWLADLIAHGGLWTDQVLLAEAYRAAAAGDAARVQEIAELALALAPSSERLRETLHTGRAFHAALAPNWPAPMLATVGDAALPIVLAVAAVTQGVGLPATLAAYVLSFISNLIGAAQRTARIGQAKAVSVLAKLETVMVATAARAAVSDLDDLGQCALLSDIASMRHETLQPRLFLS